MNSTDGLAELIAQLLLMIISIPLEFKELFWPAQSTLSDFVPIYEPKYQDTCFYITFPCRKFQLQRTKLVIDLWKNTCYVNHGDEFVFVETIYDNTPWSLLTIRFRPRINSTTIVNNFYYSNVSFNTQVNQYQLIQLEKLNQYIDGSEDLDDTKKSEYTHILHNMENGDSPGKPALNKLWEFINKNKDEIGLAADIAGIIGFILSFF